MAVQDDTFEVLAQFTARSVLKKQIPVEISTS